MLPPALRRIFFDQNGDPYPLFSPIVLRYARYCLWVFFFTLLLIPSPAMRSERWWQYEVTIDTICLVLLLMNGIPTLAAWTASLRNKTIERDVDTIVVALLAETAKQGKQLEPGCVQVIYDFDRRAADIVFISFSLMLAAKNGSATLPEGLPVSADPVEETYVAAPFETTAQPVGTTSGQTSEHEEAV